MLLGCVYRSPSNTPDDNVTFLSMLKEISLVKTNNLVLAGDFYLPGIYWNLLSYDGYGNTALRKNSMK